MKLTRKQLSGIRKWLKIDKEFRQTHTCPFKIDPDCMPNLGVTEFACDIACLAMFPRLNKKRALHPVRIPMLCPCACYQHGYVVRVARLALARRGVVGERRKHGK